MRRKGIRVAWTLVVGRKGFKIKKVAFVGAVEENITGGWMQFGENAGEFEDEGMHMRGI